MGYRLQRRARKVRKAIGDRVADRRESKAIRQELRAVYSAVKASVADVDRAKAAELVASLKKKYNLTKDEVPASDPPGAAS